MHLVSLVRGVGSANNFWAETMLGDEGNLGENKIFSGSAGSSMFCSCLTSSRSNCHGKWKNHHLLTLDGSHAAGFPEEMLHQNAQDWSQYRAGDSRGRHGSQKKVP